MIIWRFIFKKWRIWLIIPCVVITLLWLMDKCFPLPLPKDDVARIVLASDGSPLWRFADKEGVWRYPIRLEQVSPDYIQALLTYEDRWFYQHLGINPIALLRALWQNATQGKIVSGGSTLSMQVARLLDPHSRSYWGKIKQVFRTLQLEWHLSKKAILELYLNRAPFGGTLEGVAAASWTYLAKPPDQLTRAEAALLAVLPQAPSRLRPDRYPERAKQARDKVLDRLAIYQLWPVDQVNEIKQEKIFLAKAQLPQMAPLLARRLYNRNQAAIIRSTIDARLQRRLESLLKNWQVRLPEYISAAILVVDHQTMAVRAYLGSVDINDSKRFGHVDMVNAVRSPGSTLKPFLYAMAMDAGLIHSESLLQDVPRRYGDYKPGNFSAGFIGPVSASQALVMSLNLPAVQLLEAYGAKRFTNEIQGAGVPLLFPPMTVPNLAVILGGVGTRLENLVSAYSAFARQGKVAQIRLQPDDPIKERRLLSSSSAWIIRKILSGHTEPDRNNRAPLIQANKLAWKTGTSYGFRDAWAIGIGERDLIGIWIGRPDGTPVPGQFGLASATPLMLQVHDLIVNQSRLSTVPVIADSPPLNVGVAAICWPSGQSLSVHDENCRKRRFTWTIDQHTPPTLQASDQPLGSGISQTIWVNRQGLHVAADCPQALKKRIDLWPAPLEPWLPISEWRTSRLPQIDSVCPPLSQPASSPLFIVGVREGDRLRLPQISKQPLTLTLSSMGGSGMRRWWFLDGVLIKEGDVAETFHHSFLNSGKKQLVVLDEQGQVAKVAFVVE